MAVKERIPNSIGRVRRLHRRHRRRWRRRWCRRWWGRRRGRHRRRRRLPKHVATGRLFLQLLQFAGFTAGLRKVFEVQLVQPEWALRRGIVFLPIDNSQKTFGRVKPDHRAHEAFRHHLAVRSAPALLFHVDQPSFLDRVIRKGRSLCPARRFAVLGQVSVLLGLFVQVLQVHIPFLLLPLQARRKPFERPARLKAESLARLAMFRHLHLPRVILRRRRRLHIRLLAAPILVLERRATLVKIFLVLERHSQILLQGQVLVLLPMARLIHFLTGLAARMTKVDLAMDCMAKTMDWHCLLFGRVLIHPDELDFVRSDGHDSSGPKPMPVVMHERVDVHPLLQQTRRILKKLDCVLCRLIGLDLFHHLLSSTPCRRSRVRLRRGDVLIPCLLCCVSRGHSV